MIDPETGELITPFLRTAYNYDTNRASRESGVDSGGPSMAQQHFKDECDINTIVRRFGLTGELPENVRVPHDGDFTAVADYHGAMNVVRAAQESFMEMPAEVRARFANDPGQFVAFVNDPSNLEEARKLGIAKPKVEPVAPEPVLVKIAEAPGGASTSST